MKERRELTPDERAEARAILAGGCLTLLLVVFLVVITLLMSGCRSPKEIVREVTVIETHDSIHYVHDTLFFDVPVQTAQIVTHDSVSVLENDWAVSRAAVNKDGTLSHKLSTKPQSVPVPFEKPVETKTQVIYRNREVKVPVPVEKQLTPWEKFRLDAFWWLLGASVVGVGVVFRKPLFALVRRFI